MVCFNFYDDKFGFETINTIDSAIDCAEALRLWLVAQLDSAKRKLGPVVGILGITYDLSQLLLLIKESRKKDLIEEIEAILEADILEPGHAGKLKG